MNNKQKTIGAVIAGLVAIVASVIVAFAMSGNKENIKSVNRQESAQTKQVATKNGSKTVTKSSSSTSTKPTQGMPAGKKLDTKPKTSAVSKSKTAKGDKTETRVINGKKTEVVTSRKQPAANKKATVTVTKNKNAKPSKYDYDLKKNGEIIIKQDGKEHKFTRKQIQDGKKALGKTTFGSEQADVQVAYWLLYSKDHNMSLEQAAKKMGYMEY